MFPGVGGPRDGVQRGGGAGAHSLLCAPAGPEVATRYAA